MIIENSVISVSSTYLNIMLTLFTILCSATLVNVLLLFKSPKNETFKKVKIIIKSWWIIVITILVAGVFGKYGFLVLFGGLSIFSVLEYFKVTKIKFCKQEMKAFLIISILLQLVLINNYAFTHFAVFPSIYAIPTVSLLIFRSKTGQDLSRYLAVYLGVLLFTHYVLYSVAIIYSGPELLGSQDSAFVLFFLLIGLTQLNDIFQFIFGKSFGRVKIVPHLSPNKTEAGFIGGIVATTLLGGYTFNFFLGIDFNVSLGLGFCISLFGIFGDLTFSTVKRHLGIKDFSSALPGHGGLLDRLDSVIFTTPVLFHVINYFLR